MNGTWYVDSFTSEGASYTSPNGVNYTLRVSSTTHALDGNGGVNASTTQIYSGASGAFTIAPDGSISGNESGYYVNGTWYVNGGTSTSINLTLPNGHVYTSQQEPVSYSRDAEGRITSSTGGTSYGGPAGSFSVATDGSLSGSESGFYVNGTWYLNCTTTESVNYTSPNGRLYTTRTVNHNYMRDESGNITDSGSGETYSGSGVSFTIGSDGAISGDESGYVVNGNWYVNSSGSRSAGGTMTLFGTTYTGTGGSESTSYNSNGSSSYGYNDSYSNADGSYLTVSFSQSDTGTSQTSTSGWDYYVGSFSSDSSGNLVFSPRYGPSFLPAQVWVDGTLLNFQSGTVDASGIVSDSYSGTTGQGSTLTLGISAQMREYETNGASATVMVNSGSVGTLTKSGGLSTSGYDVQISDQNRSSPLFFTGSVLWVNGCEHPFSGGYEDSAGNRTDTYSALGGGTLRIIGSLNNPTTATVNVVWNGMTYSGTASFGGGSATFEAGEYANISTLPPGSPPALWAAGRFYLRQPGSNRFVCTAGTGDTATTYQLDLSGTSVQQLSLSGSSSGGVLSGTFDATQGGVFAVMQNGSVPVPACAANTDGSLRLGAAAVPDQLPPAVMVSGAGILRFIGTLNENNLGVACYANSSAANSTEAGDGAGCVLKIGTTDGSVTLQNYVAGSTSTGSYSTGTHLFQTGTSSSLPMPLLAVDPNANDTLWGLSAPPEGPASFQVGQDQWRYVGAGENGASLYQGYYSGQQLTLGTAGAGGGRLVNVTDPVHGNTTGLLNDVRAGTRLNNGTMVYAGGLDGTRAPSSVNQNGLLALSGNLDIPGNLLTLGSLTGDAAASGLTLQFSDSMNGSGQSVALLRQELGRGAAQWSWFRASPVNGTGSVPVMALDSAWGLTLYDPANPSAAAINLNPATGTITLGGQPVLTQSAADARYLRADQAGGGSSAILTQDSADARYHPKGQPLRVAPAGDIDMGEFTNGPQP